MNNYLYIDLETTGLSDQDEIVEIAIINDADDILLNTLIRPSRHSQWPEAENIHGISPDAVKNFPSLRAYESVIRDIVSGQNIVIYNAQYDMKYLKFISDCNINVSCAMLAFAELYGDWNEYHQSYTWKTLGIAANHVGYKMMNAHRAIDDTRAVRAVWQWCLKEMKK